MMNSRKKNKGTFVSLKKNHKMIEELKKLKNSDESFKGELGKE